MKKGIEHEVWPTTVKKTEKEVRKFITHSLELQTFVKFLQIIPAIKKLHIQFRGSLILNMAPLILLQSSEM